MDLKDFIQQTITQIAEGTVLSQEKIKELEGEINPYINANHEQLGKQGYLFTPDGIVQFVSFDVALTVIEGKGTKGGIGVFAGAINLGSSGQSNNETSSVSRIKFSIPLRLPRHK